MKRLSIPWLFLLCLVGAGAFLAAKAVNSDDRPRAEFPQVVEVGDAEEGKAVEGYFRVANQGQSPLRLVEFQSSCGCAAVEREDNGIRYAVRQVDLPAGRHEDLFLRWTVRGPVGSTQRMSATFHTNDDRQPIGRVEFVVRSILGGAAAVPAQAMLGTPLIGEPTRQVVMIYDRASAARAIAQVDGSLLPDGVRAKLLEPNSAAPGADRDLGVVIGAIEVTANSSKPGPVKGLIRVFAAGDERPIVEVPVSGDVVPAIGLSPPLLVLPRRSESGNLHGGTFICRSRRPGRLDVTLPDTPNGLRAEVIAVDGDPSTKLIRVELVGEARDTIGEMFVPVKASTDNTQTVDLALHIDRRPLSAAGGR
jgi:Protein of unknown function (DUF1573)